jgi:hypothetical protein
MSWMLLSDNLFDFFILVVVTIMGFKSPDILGSLPLVS